MTIASAFNDIAVAQGGTAAKSGAITAAIDALNDALAGSDQPQAKTIEQAVRLLGEHIGGGGGGGAVKCYIINDDDWETPLNTADVSVEDGNGASISVSTDELTVEGPMGAETFACLSFTANVGGVYKIGRGTSAHYLTSGTLVLSTLGPGDNLPCSFEDSTLSFVSPSADTAARVILG